MNKIKNLFIFLSLVLFLSFAIFVKANETKKVSISISHQLESGIQDPLVSEYDFGGTITINKLEDKPFLYHVVNGKLRLDLDYPYTLKSYSNYNIKLVYGSETNKHAVTFVDTNLDHLSTVYVDDNGDPIEPNEPVKPKSVFLGWVLLKDYDTEVIPVKNVSGVNSNCVYVAKYTLNESAQTETYNVSINGVSNSYHINEVVTATAGEAPAEKVFSHWEDDFGHVLSLNPIYKFTVMTDTTITAVFKDSKVYTGPIVNMSNALNLKEGYVSYKGQFELVEGYELVEYGFLFSRSSDILVYDDLGVTVAQSNVYYKETKEFLRSFPIDTFNSIRAYLIVNNTKTGSIEVVYSDNYERYPNETELLLYETGFSNSTVDENAEKTSITEKYDDLEITWTGVKTYISAENGINSNSVKFGSSSAVGSLKSPYVFKNVYKIDLILKRWTGDSGNVSVSVSNGAGNDYKQLAEIEITDKFVAYSIIVDYNVLGYANNDSISIKIEGTTASKGRFYLDNIKVHAKTSSASHEIIYNNTNFVKEFISEGALITRVPTLEGYSFVGWYLNDALTIPYNTSDPVVQSLDLYAKWSKLAKYTVTFNPNNGSDIFTQDVYENNLAIVPDNLTKAGYIFIGWYLEDVPFDFDAPITSDITLIANWKEEVSETKYVASIVSSGKYSSVISDGVISSDRLNITNDGLAEITVSFQKNSSQATIFNNSADEIRLYKGSGNGGALKIQLQQGYVIEKIEITTSANAGYSINGTGPYTDLFKEILLDSVQLVEIKNVGSDQVRIKNISITYKKVNP